MSFIPATSPRDGLTILAVVGAVAVLGVFLRRASSAPPAPGVPGSLASGSDDPDPARADDEDDPAGEDGSGEPPQVPISSEGVAFVSRPHGVLLLSVAGREQAPDWLDTAIESNFVPYTVLNELYFAGAGGGIQPGRIGTPLDAGDLTGARIVRGAAGADPWRLETLGRDGDYGFHPFTTREAAEAALDALVKHGVVQRPDDEENHVVPASAEDFEEARRRYEETASNLAIDPDGEEPPREGAWVSDRR